MKLGAICSAISTESVAPIANPPAKVYSLLVQFGSANIKSEGMMSFTVTLVAATAPWL